MQRGLLLRDAGTETFEAGRCGERVVRNAVGPAEGVRPDSIFPLPKGLRSVKCCAVRLGRLVPCEKAAFGPASMYLAERIRYAERHGEKHIPQSNHGSAAAKVSKNRYLGLRVLSGRNPTALPERTRKRRKAGAWARHFGSAGSAFRAGRSPYSVSATTRTIARASVSSS